MGLLLWCLLSDPIVVVVKAVGVESSVVVAVIDVDIVVGIFLFGDDRGALVVHLAGQTFSVIKVSLSVHWIHPH